MKAHGGREFPAIALACALIVAAYAFAARSGVLESSAGAAANTTYNLLVRGLRSGHLSLDRAVPSGLAALADPYDPLANAVYRSGRYGLHDLSYHDGKLYSYFGITPALILFWPCLALTGHFLFHRQAVAICCGIGFLASVWLLGQCRRRYFADLGQSAMLLGVAAVGLASGLPLLLARSDVYEVAIACGYMLMMLAAGAIWAALHASGGRRAGWLASASLAIGLAVGARPSLLPAALILAIPLLAGPRAQGLRRPATLLWVAAMVPLGLCGLGLALYNYGRFGDIAEFGQKYQLSGLAFTDRGSSAHFALGNLWFNFRVYFLEPVRWTRHFPYVAGIPVPPLPASHHAVEDPYGILTNVPFVWLALALPLAWRGRSGDDRRPLGWLAAGLGWMTASGAAVILLLDGSCSRYEVDFLPALILLAVLGWFGCERTLAYRPLVRWGVRVTALVLLAGSVAFNGLAAVEHYAEARCDTGVVLMAAGRLPEAIQADRDALRARPDYPDAHNNLGVALARSGQRAAAMEEYRAVLRFAPESFQARVNLGNALAQSGRLAEAVEQYQAALRIDPSNADTHYNLGQALGQLGRVSEGQAQLAEAARLEASP